MTSDLLTAAQAAERVDRPLRTVQYWATTGRLPVALKLPGLTGAYLFRPEDVDAAAAGSPTPEEAA